MILFALLIAGSFSFGAMTAPHIGAAPLNSIRFAIGAAIIAVIAFGVRREPLRLPPAPWRFLVLGALMGVYFVTMFVALGIALPVSVGAVFTLNPLLAAVFGFFVLGQSARPVVIASLLVAGAGALWVIFRGDVEAMMGLRIGRGEAIFAVGVACHALYAPLFRRFARSEPVVVSTFWVLLFTGICITLYGARDILATDWTSMPAMVWIAISYLAVFATAATFFLVQFASLRLPAAKVFAYGYLTPSFVIVLEGLIGHGWASGAVLSGAVVIVLGLIVLAFAPDG
ncbi:DMT family transporter [Oricola thermophila]|uniref:DMT family transporter n=2 Tax=Oricola thermophila TaxID=2742145 RepID=A0A6N1VHY0_9HYPH|nr:DMT family transporter [Oricola thermophila]